MPSANPKLEKQASTEASDPIRQAIIVIEHKIRNLEKRKLKLESYREIQKTGKELNHDQKIAVAKYDEVLQTLDITRELCKQIVSIANDSAKQQKKIARKEALERMQQDISKVREVLLIQDILMNMNGDAVREDFLTGSNGALKLTQNDLKFLDDLYAEMMIKRKTEPDELPFAQQLQKAAEHYVAIVEGKQREVVGTTYIKLKEIITSVIQSGYFDQVPAQETETVVEFAAAISTEVHTTDDSAPEPSADEYNVGDAHIPPPESMIPMPNFPVQVTPVPVVSGTAPVAGPIPVVAPPQAIPPHGTAPVDTFYANATGYVPSPQSNQQQQPQQTPRINDVIGTPNFFFLQESELDSPDITAQQPQSQQQQTTAATVVSHIPPTLNAPIPTQTYTNQNFGGAPVPVTQQVIYQHPPQEMPHIPGFANPNPPPPIPMPPSHQQQNVPYSPQHVSSFQPQQPGQPIQSQTHQQPQQNFESHPQQDVQSDSTEDKVDSLRGESGNGVTQNDHQTEQVDWCQMTEAPVDEWGSNDTHHQQTGHQDQPQAPQQAWGEQRSGYRGRGGRRINSNNYNGRGRGGGNGGGYQQNGRTNSGQGSYYRNDSNYQNGYQPRNYNNDGNSNYNGNFKRGGGRGGSRGGNSGSGSGGGGGGGDRINIERGGGRGGQFRGQRGGNRGTYIPRGKSQTQQ